MVLDTTGVDIWSRMQAAAALWHVDPVLLLALCKAESGLNPTAAREGVWPDVSYGPGQICVATAASLGYGDGSNTAANRALVRDLLTNWAMGLDATARLLADCVRRADGDWLGSLVCYNAGHIPPPGDPWWTRWAGNVASYQRALAWAKQAAVQ